MKDIEEPVISRYDPTQAPIMSLAVTGDNSLLERSQLVEQVIKPRLETVSGVGMVEVAGDEEREIHIDLNADRLNAYAVSPAEVAAALQRSNVEVPAGNLNDQGRAVSVRRALDTVPDLGHIFHLITRQQLRCLLRTGSQTSIGINGIVFCPYTSKPTISPADNRTMTQAAKVFCIFPPED